MSDFVSRSDIVLGPNQYGKAEVRVVRVSREADTHTLQDLNVTSFLRGDYQRCYTEGDNTSVIATDTQKNTVYAFAKKYGIVTPEQFLHTLGQHFVDAPQVEGGRWTADSYPWERISVRGEPHPHSFVRSKQEVRTAAVTIQDGDAHILTGFKDLTVLKSTGSEFHGFPATSTPPCRRSPIGSWPPTSPPGGSTHPTSASAASTSTTHMRGPSSRCSSSSPWFTPCLFSRRSTRREGGARGSSGDRGHSVRDAQQPPLRREPRTFRPRESQ